MSSEPVGEIFRKGQIIPKRIGHVFVHRKARHLLTFGCDVEVKGNLWTAIEPNGIAIINVPANIAIRHNNGTRQKVTAGFIGLHIDCANKIPKVIHF